MSMKKYTILSVLFFLLLPLLSRGQQNSPITIQKASGIVDPIIPKDEAIYEFVANRSDLRVVTNNSKIDMVDPNIYPEGELTRYKVRLKLKDGRGYSQLERRFTLTVKNTTISGRLIHKGLKGGHRYVATVDVPEVVIDYSDKSEQTDVYTSQTEAAVILQSKYELEISRLGFKGPLNRIDTFENGLYKHTIVIAIDGLDSNGNESLLASVKGKKSNIISIGISDLRSRVRKTYVISQVNMPVEDNRKGDVIFKVTPSDEQAFITFNGKKEVIKNGEYTDFVRYGAYPYVVSIPNYYHADSGVLVLNETRKVCEINLKIRYGTLIVEGDSSNIGATIFLNGEEVGVVPDTIRRVISGEPTLALQKKYCRFYEKKITIEDGKTLSIKPEMKVVYGRLVLTVDDDAEIWIRNKMVGKGRYEGDYDGVVEVICKKEHHYDSRKNIQVVAGQTTNVHLPSPTPKYGVLHIKTTPTHAKVYIDNVLWKDPTPVTIENIIEGKHVVLIQSKGMAPAYNDVEIKENETTDLSVPLQQAHSVKIRVTPKQPIYTVKVNGRDWGLIKTMELAEGSHHVTVEAKGYEPFSKTVSVPGEKEVRFNLRKQQFRVVVTCDEADSKVQRDEKAELVSVDKTFHLDYGQHHLKVIGNGIETDFSVFIDQDTTFDVNFERLRSGDGASDAAAQTKSSKGKPKENNVAAVPIADSKAEPKSEKTEEVKEGGNAIPKQRVDVNAAFVDAQQENGEYYEADDEDEEYDEDGEMVEALNKQFKYKDFSRWTLDINMATSREKLNMYGSTLTITGKRGWGFYLSGYLGNKYRYSLYDRYVDPVPYYYGFDVIDEPYFDWSKTDKPGNSWLWTLGVDRRIGSSHSVVDIQLYLGGGLMFYNTYRPYKSYIFNSEVSDYVEYTYLKINGTRMDFCIDAGMRFGLDHRTKFGWFNFTLGGMYVVGLDRFYFTGGISLGNALVAGTVAGFLGIPSEF